MTAPSTDDLIYRLREAANGGGSSGGPRCLHTAAADRIETLRKAAEGMAEALRGVAEDVCEHENGYATVFEIGDEAVDRCAAALAAYEELKP